MKYIQNRKLHCACLLLMLFFLLMAIPVQAEDISEDSVNIAPDIINMLEPEEGEKVVCIYQTYVNDVFWTCSNIEEFLSFDHGVRTYIFYVVISTDGTSRCYILDDNKCIPYEDWKSIYYAEYFPLVNLLLSDDLLAELDPNIVIENKYYLNGGLNYGYAIYCKTNQGDYIYYHYEGKSAYGAKGSYIFSLEAFLDYQKVVESNYQRIAAMHPDGWVGGCGDGDSDLDLDLSAYEIGSENFNPDAKFVLPEDHSNQWLVPVSIALSACLLSAATIAALRFRRKKQAQA